MTQPEDDHIFEDADVDDKANDHALPTNQGEDKSPKEREDDFISDKRSE